MILFADAKAGTINRIFDELVDKYHKNDHRYRFADIDHFISVSDTLPYLP